MISEKGSPFGFFFEKSFASMFLLPGFKKQVLLDSLMRRCLRLFSKARIPTLSASLVVILASVLLPTIFSASN